MMPQALDVANMLAMPKPTPIACRPIAFRMFAAQLPTLATNRGLLRTAVAISMHELPDVDADVVEQGVMDIAARIRRRLTNPLPAALLAHLHEELFESLHLRGNIDDYYNAQNSYLPSVMATGLGIPISLSLIYAVVARELGLRAEGINAPGHFLVQVAAGGAPMYVDPFYRGEMLTREDALSRITAAIGRPLVSHAAGGDESLRPATHQQWIARMIHNLVNLFAADGRSRDVAAMSEMMALLDGSLF